MSTSVLPYANVLNDGEEIDYIVIKFSGFNSSILVHEEYCVNPGCSCADAVLRFIELSDDGGPVNDWFLIRLDMHTWKVTEKKVFNKMIKAEKMIKEFVDNIDEFKEKLLSHLIKAKEYGKKHYMDYMSESTVKMILDGNVMAYSEIFGSCDIDKFSFEFNETEKWFFNDQYCSNPKCLCSETVLTFFKIDDTKKTQEQIAKTGFSQERYLRTLINGYIPKELPTPDYHAMMKELRAIGNNLNQIAARANATGHIDRTVFQYEANWVRKVVLDIKAAVTLPEKGGNSNQHTFISKTIIEKTL